MPVKIFDLRFANCVGKPMAVALEAIGAAFAGENPPSRPLFGAGQSF
jgi:hypothetical protein